MPYPPKKHQALFINPTISGLFTAWLTKQLGADVGIVRDDVPDAVGIPYSAAYPHLGTFTPEVIDSLASETGFIPPRWEKFSTLTLKTIGSELKLNSDDGPGGLLIALTRQLDECRGIITDWLTPHIENAGLIRDGESVPFENLPDEPVASCLDDLCETHKHSLEPDEIDTFRIILDSITILTTGKSLTETRTGELPHVFARFLNGWYIPSRLEKNWSEPIIHKMIEHEIAFHDVEKIESLELVNESNTRVITSDGYTFDSELVAVPENSRFVHPSDVSPSTLIFWHSIPCDITDAFTDFDLVSSTGIVRPAQARPPVNDNFISWLFSPNEKIITLAAPVEHRFLDNQPDRLRMLCNNIIELASVETRFELDPFAVSEDTGIPEILTFPGISTMIKIPDKPAFGTDLAFRMNACVSIAEQIVSKLP